MGNLNKTTAQIQAALDLITTEKQQSPIQYYGTSEVFVNYPGPAETDLSGDIAFADDRTGATGKLWAFYYDSNNRIVRMEVPYVGCLASELINPVTATGLHARINRFVYIDGFWYAGCVGDLYKFTNGIDQNPTLLSTVATIGQNGDQTFVANLCVDRDGAGLWHAWYSTYNGTNNGIRHATSTDAITWSIGAGFWLTPTDVNSTLNWIRIFYPMKDKWGRLWGVVGGGNKWGGTGNPGKDDGASVWVAPVVSFNTKPISWKCVVRPPYFSAIPYGSPFINNAYAPAFLQDGDNWFLYVNTGFYGHERIICLKPKLSESWQNIFYDTSDITLTITPAIPDCSKCTIRDGIYRITYAGQAFSYYASPQWHSVRMKIIADNGEVFADKLIQIGDHEWESRDLSMSAIISAKESRSIYLNVSYEVGGGQVAPALNTSRIRALSLSVEKLY